MTNHAGEIVRGILTFALIIGAVGFVVVRSVLKAEDPARMILKWLVTLGVVVFMIWVAIPALLQDGYAALHGLSLVLICAVVMVATWRHNIASLVADPIGALYDGGTTPPDPHPAYSVALARQKQGRYLEAIAEIRKQLDRFPTDVEGQLLLAQIQAEDLKDLPAAEITIQHFCEQPGHAPQNIVFALYSLADWHRKIGQDLEAARRDLERVIALLPDSEFSLGAAHRIAHLGGPKMLLPPHEREKFIVAEGAQNLGLLHSQAHLRPAEPDPAQVAADYVKHLELHPLDTEARERLAVIYTDHYKRLDLATDQLEQLIQEPHQPAKLVVHWLNLLADLQVRSGADYETIRQTLQRIVDRDPNFAGAEIARHRLALLKLELKAKDKSQAVKLGSYEQNIGLKQGSGTGHLPADPAPD
jgi:tetratricopeptide (TPR) repeat protein